MQQWRNYYSPKKVWANVRLLVRAERIDAHKEFCDCKFEWSFAAGKAHGISIGGKSVAVAPTEMKKAYKRQEFSAEAAAAIECEQIVGSYFVKFDR